MEVRNIYANMPFDQSIEHIETLHLGKCFKLERIVSHGQATASGEWYDQGHAEWVLLLKGSAGLLVEGGEVRRLMPGDCIHLPAHCRHRVEWTQAEEETIWLALHHWE